MKKEIIWNVGLFTLGIILSYLFMPPLPYHGNLNDVFRFSGNHSSTFLYTGHLMQGLGMGGALIMFRYVHLAILKIANHDLKVFVLILSYALVMLLSWYWPGMINPYAVRTSTDNVVPTNDIQLKIKGLRELGFFKKYASESDNMVTDLVVGRLLRSQYGYFDAEAISDSGTNIPVMNLLALDFDKICSNVDSEWAVEGNYGYEKFVKALSYISEGHVVLDSIDERWVAKNSVKITLQIGTTLHEIRPTVKDDWADTKTVIAYLNNLLNTQKVDFQFYYLDDEESLIAGLTKSEKEKLANKYPWPIRNPLD